VLEEPHNQNEAARRRFVAEARLLAEINHPNVIDVLDVGEIAGGRPFYVMSFVRGTSLARLLARQSRLLPLDASLHIAIRVASALHAAHRAIDGFGRALDIVHRDVNPTNILIGQRGTIKLIDFGIAVSVLGPRETRVNVVKGNPRYLSPEQAFGLEADVRSDVYSLALTLYESITGRAPLATHDRSEGLALARDPEIAPPSHFRPSVNAELDGVVMRALSREPERRFQSMDALARALQACLVEVNPSFLPESLDLLLTGADLPRAVPPTSGTVRIAGPNAGVSEDELPTAVFQRPEGDDEPTVVDPPSLGSDPSSRS